MGVLGRNAPILGTKIGEPVKKPSEIGTKKKRRNDPPPFFSNENKDKACYCLITFFTQRFPSLSLILMK